ncbi:hypothetical protein [Marinobacterium rhizophilum]|uniref:Ogr/Delta-like zinc finger protein n=1 Tax=Marinobacterium rhizophilum TaxID=420402 RepID=A0ABY5HJU4_9GAMM|nr:hypothetical protein [Marinobacterium rhizophilum]UTW12657.1 hypothetical protein KDW95_02955 [Marinobacterium rhizophilum]
MESTCPSCELLITQQRHHPYLVNISSLQDSQLYKCRCCNSYLHRYLSQWEIISIGFYDEKQGPPAPGNEADNGPDTSVFASALGHSRGGH